MSFLFKKQKQGLWADAERRSEMRMRIEHRLLETSEDMGAVSGEMENQGRDMI